MRGVRAVLLAAAVLLGAAAAEAKLLVPMDLRQSNHLKAYGLAYWSLQQGATVEWLLNYRGGAFLMEDFEALRGKRSGAIRALLDVAEVFPGARLLR